MPLPLTVSCFSKIQIGFTFLVPAHLGSPGQRALKRVCVCVWTCLLFRATLGLLGLVFGVTAEILKTELVLVLGLQSLQSVNS